MSLKYICMLFRYVSRNVDMLCAGYRIWFDTWLMLVAGPSDLLQHDTCSCKIQLQVELEEGIAFCVADTKNKGRKCGLWNTLCRKKLKEVVASARTTFRWQSPKEGERLQDGACKDCLSSRPLALRPIYWEISSDAYTCSKWGSSESNWTQSAEGSESDEIHRKCLTQEEERGCNRIQAGL